MTPRMTSARSDRVLQPIAVGFVRVAVETDSQDDKTCCVPSSTGGATAGRGGQEAGDEGWATVRLCCAVAEVPALPGDVAAIPEGERATAEA